MLKFVSTSVVPQSLGLKVPFPPRTAALRSSGFQNSLARATSISSEPYHFGLLAFLTASSLCE